MCRRGGPVDAEAERRLHRALLAVGLPVVAKPVVEGYEVDFAIVEGSRRLAVEFDGSQHVDAGGRQRRQDLARDAVLAKLGWSNLRVPAWRCLSEPDAVAADAAVAWARLGLPGAVPAPA